MTLLPMRPRKYGWSWGEGVQYPPGQDPRKTQAENEGAEGLFDREEDDWGWEAPGDVSKPVLYAAAPGQADDAAAPKSASVPDRVDRPGVPAANSLLTQDFDAWANGLTPDMEAFAKKVTKMPIQNTPLQIYPVPEYTGVTRNPNLKPGQGSGEFMDRNERPHRGLDFAAPPGKAIVSPGDGVVVSANNLPGYGNQIAIRHADGITTQVGHIGSINVKEGDRVTAGQVIGITGDGNDRKAAGNAYGLSPHVHFEVRGGNGLPYKNGGIICNPRDYLPWRNPHD